MKVRAFTIFGDELLGLIAGAFALGAIFSDVTKRGPRVELVMVPTHPEAPAVEATPEPAPAPVKDTAK